MVVVNNFSEGRTEKAHEGFSKTPAPLYNKRKAKPSRSVPFLLIVAGKNAAGRLIFAITTPVLKKSEKRRGHYSMGSGTFRILRLWRAAAMCVCV